ncbi:MAG: LamG domain-containing protein [Labilithrix sp.]|nr:LamG domain-containing protein [Labilithrix sp.]
MLLAAACSSGPLALGRLDDGVIAGDDAGGVADGADGPGDVCEPPPPARHFAFDGVGTEVIDLRGGPSGRVVGGAALDGSGVLRLDGVDDYVDLPNGVLANLSAVSVAVWVRRLGGPAYTRIFDLGTGSLGEDPPAGTPAVGRSYLAVTPATGNVPSGLAVLMSADGAAGEAVALSDVALDEELRLVVVTVSSGAVSLFHEGALVARVPRTVPLSGIVDHNAWLGRSQYAADPHLAAEYADVRVWEEALTDCAVRTLHARGPSAP